jgi:hypothetical protein
MRLLTLLLFAALSFSRESCMAQGKEKLNAPITVRGNIGIPKPVSSKMFRKSFTGIYEANVSVNLCLVGNLHAGAGYQHSFLRNNDFLKFHYFNASIPYSTRLSGHAGFARVGYDKFFSDKGYMSYALNGGMMSCRYLNVNEDTTAANKPFGATRFSVPFLQPELTVNFIAERYLSFSLIFSYTTLFSTYDPKAPRFGQFAEVTNASNRYMMSWINFGFGFNVLIGK